MTYFFLPAFLFLHLLTVGQILDNDEGNLFSNAPFFNEDFINTNGIKSIKGSIAIKKELKTIKELGLSEEYHFNKKGQLIHQLETFYQTGRKLDTTIISYFYDDQNRLMRKRTNDVHGFYSHTFEYDSLGNLIRETYAREIHEGAEKMGFQPEKEFVIRSETFSWSKIAKNRWEKLFYNSKGKKYKEQSREFDEQGNIIEKKDQYVYTGKSIITRYEYNQSGFLAIKETKSNLFGNKEEVIIYDYDGIGNILEEKISENGEDKSIIQYLYNEESMLLKAKLIKDMKTQSINIIQYEYEFITE